VTHKRRRKERRISRLTKGLGYNNWTYLRSRRRAALIRKHDAYERHYGPISAGEGHVLHVTGNAHRWEPEAA
jgi:hypothetical protein